MQPSLSQFVEQLNVRHHRRLCSANTSTAIFVRPERQYQH